jgi:hypothetical protein
MLKSTNYPRENWKRSASKYFWDAAQHALKMPHPQITIIGKPGCIKCSKMETILKSRGYETNLTYIKKSGTHKINNINLSITDKTKFPLYLINHQIFETLKDLNMELKSYTPNEC